MAGMSNRLIPPIPTAAAVAGPLGIPSAVPTDGNGNSLIPELRGRNPTHNEALIISGEPIAMASTNVSEIWWAWEQRRLFVEFLDGSLYAYEGVGLDTVRDMVETASPGRYVWNYLRDRFPYRRLQKGTQKRPPQVIRLMK